MSEKSSAKFNNPSVYETYVGRWSQVIARQFVNWLDIVPGSAWLDVGAGTGILTQVILNQTSPEKVVGIDPSAHFIEFAKQRVEDGRAQFIVGVLGDLTPDQPQFDVAVAGLVLNFVPSPEQTLEEMRMLVKHGGVVAAYVWDYAGEMQMMRHFWDAAAKVDPSSVELDSGKRFTFCNPDGLRQLFQSQMLTDIEVKAIDVPAHFKNIDDYWQPFLAAQGSVSKYLRSLDDKTLAAIREQLGSQLPIEDDGTIDLINRAWVVKGRLNII